MVWEAATNCSLWTCPLSAQRLIFLFELKVKDAENNLSSKNCIRHPQRSWFHRRQTCLFCVLLLLSMKRGSRRDPTAAVVQRAAPVPGWSGCEKPLVETPLGRAFLCGKVRVSQGRQNIALWGSSKRDGGCPGRALEQGCSFGL